jgi:hypothetical protein
MIRPLVFVLTIAVSAAAFAQADPGAARTDLPTVTIPQAVTANGQPLAPGTYQIRITVERPSLPSGIPSDAQRWVEFLADGKIVAREIAEVLPLDGGATPVGTSSATPSRPPVVQLLKEGDFVRVSLREAGQRYLVYLPTGTPRVP